jgi:hypothetical protein
MTERKRKTSRPKMRGDEPTTADPAMGPRPRRARGDEPTLVAPTTTVLHRVVDGAELAKIEASGHRRFPRPTATFTLLSDESRARLARGSGWVTRFSVQNDVLARYPKLGGSRDAEYAIPAAEVEMLNDAIIGPIVVLR